MGRFREKERGGEERGGDEREKSLGLMGTIPLAISG
jgi:hypothetical protein